MRNNFGLQDIGGLGLLGFAVYGGIKLIQLNSIAKNLDTSLKDLADKTPVEINQSVMDKAVERAVNREVSAAVQTTARRVGDQVRNDLNKEVRAAVKSQYDDIADKVTKKVSDEVSQINKTALSQKIADRAEDLVIQKLENSTDEALEKFNRGLGNITKIYEGISNVMSGASGKHKNALTFSLD